MKQLTAILAVLVSTSFPAFATDQVTVFGEFHQTEESHRLWQSAIDKAAVGKATILFEAIPRAANQDTGLKREFLLNMGIPYTANTAKFIMGVDNETLQFLDILVGMYLTSKSSQVDEYFIYALCEFLLRERLMQQFDLLGGDLSSETSLFSYKDPDKLMEKIVDLYRWHRPEFQQIILRTYVKVSTCAQTHGLEFHYLDLATYTDSFDDYAEQSIKFRNSYIAESIAEAAKSSSVPCEVLLGEYHVDGVADYLRSKWPHLKLNVRHGR